MDDGDGERYTREGRDGKLKFVGRKNDTKESVLIDIDERVISQVLAEVFTNLIRGFRTD